MKGEKYLELTKYLERSGKDVIKMTFSEIEKCLGFNLFDSAYEYPAFWSNTTTHSIAYGWLNAGYRSRNADLKNKTVEFVKEGVSAVPERKSANTGTAPVSLLSEGYAEHCIRQYHQTTVEDPHGRYMSWQHCYDAFTKSRGNKNAAMVDYLALHLAFYLASWGMYRGSSFLFQKDYKIHVPVVKITLENRYDPLSGISAGSLLIKENLLLIDEIGNRIRKAYAEERPSFEGAVNNATDTLVTKILLGTLGCVPAYDRYYVQTVRKYNISSGNYNMDSVRAVAQYYQEHVDVFEKLRRELNEGGTTYTSMKLMDMCMWQVAFNDEMADEEKGE